MDMVEALTGFRDWLKEDSKDRPKGLSLIHDILKPAGRGIYDLANMSGQAAQGQYIEPTAITKPLMDAGIGQGALAFTKAALMKDALMDPNTLNAFVWQGGPHKYGHTVPSLDPSKREGTSAALQHIGRGQGHATYGYGDYRAGAKKTGEKYREDLAEYTDEIEAMDMKVSDAARVLDNYHKLDPLRAAAESDYRKALEDLKSAKMNSSYLYKHDLPDEDIARYLDWDAPLSEQPESVRAAIQQSGLDWSERWSGGDFYNFLAEDLGAEEAFATSKIGFKDKKAASEALGKAGIPGLKYYDGMSRGAGEGTRNYVTWDQDVLDRMKLLERNGVDMTKALMGNQ